MEVHQYRPGCEGSLNCAFYVQGLLEELLKGASVSSLRVRIDLDTFSALHLHAVPQI